MEGGPPSPQRGPTPAVLLLLLLLSGASVWGFVPVGTASGPGLPSPPETPQPCTIGPLPLSPHPLPPASTGKAFWLLCSLFYLRYLPHSWGLVHI